MKNVIIGAGPAGLYAAIKLKKSGIKDVVIYDPRAGVYTRPGHLNPNVFAKVERELGLSFPPGRNHIKTLERALFQEATRLGVIIENKTFVRMHRDARTPGVIVANATGSEEVVVTNYVFDCTGSRRDVVKAVNSMCPDSQLKVKAFTTPPVLNHFIAYVKMSEAQLSALSEISELVESVPSAINSAFFVKSMVKLRSQGWNEMVFPRAYGVEFGKDKTCLYLHAPK